MIKAFFHRSRIYPLILILAVFVVWKIRQGKKSDFVSFSGLTMGSITYNIKYIDKKHRDFKPQVDSLLKDFNNSLNHYQPDSEISQFNTDTIFHFKSSYFYPVLKRSKEVYELTNGAFDPTIGQLINAWGFGPDAWQKMDSSMIDSLKQLVYFENITFNRDMVRKEKAGIKLDFSAIAKGYAVDIIADFIRNQGIEHLFVEIGGELTCNGNNEKGKPWVIGIIDPRSDLINQETFASLNISGMAMATSANNYNYIVKKGIRYVHTIDPATGYPIQNNLLSATVVASDCMTADAFATAFMVMGLEKSIYLLESEDSLQGILIYNDHDGIKTYVSKELKDNFNILND